jgi:acetate kinase
MSGPVLVLNTGSSSVKHAVYDMAEQAETLVTDGGCPRVLGRADDAVDHILDQLGADDLVADLAARRSVAWVERWSAPEVAAVSY